MGSGSLTNELIDFFHASPQMPTPSAFLQQRSKIKLEAFRSIFDGFNETITKGFSEKMPIFAVDDIQIATTPGDTGSYYPGSNGQKGYNLLHLNALYEIDYHIYADSIIQKSKESYNSMAHIQEKGWYFLIRIKDGHGSIKSNLELPKEKLFDLKINLNITRKQSKEVKELLKDKNHYRYLHSNVNFDYLPAKSNYKDPASFYGLSFRNLARESSAIL